MQELNSTLGGRARDVAKVPRRGGGPTLHSILHRSSSLQGVCWSSASPQFLEGWKGQGRNFFSWQILNAGGERKGVRATGSAGWEEEGGAGKEEAHWRHINNSARAGQTTPNHTSELLPSYRASSTVQAFNKRVHCLRSVWIHSVYIFPKLYTAKP